MKKIIIGFLFFVWIFLPKSIYALEITADPQYIVINFSDTFHFLNWSADEKKWQTEVKPKAKQRLRNIKALLTIGQTPQRQLAWSTLMEYTNYPLDSNSESSPYVIRLKRMMELAEEEKFPIFIPLNGIQWWDELPELWNWWDYDGNQTPGCTNNDYSRCGFPKLKDPDYRQRFIKGYDPNNKWNVDWQDWQTPMKFITRNWGGGDFLVAPSPNIVDHGRSKLSFKKLQKSRYELLIKTVSRIVNRWGEESKQYLFAGITIGTEVTLNGAVKPGDSEFKPYGFRAIQDVFCPPTQPLCGDKQDWTDNQLERMRQQIIFQYFNELAWIASKNGLPKQRVYTHVWSEASPGEIKYTDAIGASITYFSRPGMSLYGKANDPLAFPLLLDTLSNNGFPQWAAPEFAPLIRDQINWQQALTNTLDNNLAPAKLIDIYNEADILNTPAIAELNQFLAKKPDTVACFISETIPTTDNRSVNPPLLTWKLLDKNDQAEKLSLLIWEKNQWPGKKDINIKEYPLNEKNKEVFSLPKNLERGFYYWAIKRTGCDGKKWTISTPRLLFNFPPLPEIPIPGWVKWVNKIVRLW